MQNTALDLTHINKSLVFYDYQNYMNIAYFQTSLFRNDQKKKLIKPAKW